MMPSSVLFGFAILFASCFVQPVASFPNPPFPRVPLSLSQPIQATDGSSEGSPGANAPDSLLRSSGPSLSDDIGLDQLKTLVSEILEQLKQNMSTLHDKIRTFENQIGLLENQIGLLENQIGLLENQIGLLENHIGLLDFGNQTDVATFNITSWNGIVEMANQLEVGNVDSFLYSFGQALTAIVIRMPQGEGRSTLENILGLNGGNEEEANTNDVVMSINMLVH